eukprot:6195095-Pleurochrysis_carterae.AAC.1
MTRKQPARLKVALNDRVHAIGHSCQKTGPIPKHTRARDLCTAGGGGDREERVGQRLLGGAGGEVTLLSLVLGECRNEAAKDEGPKNEGRLEERGACDAARSKVAVCRPGVRAVGTY